jgi:hypothetical protein
MAQNCVDMKGQHSINKPSGDGWYRCKSLTFAGETATWELSRTGRYGFLDAYKMTPHRQLIRATDDSLLRVFVKAWGPLRSILNAWSGNDPIDDYRRERDRLTVGARLLASVEEPELRRPALLGLVKSLSADEMFPSILGGLRKRYSGSINFGDGGAEGHEAWVESLRDRQLEEVTAEIAPYFARSAISPRYSVERTRAGNVLKASLTIFNLSEAMTWMFWQDVSQHHPMQFCVECRGLIEFKTHHAKRFCSPECAHRKTARESARRRRQEERRTNGAEKTR